MKPFHILSLLIALCLFSCADPQSKLIRAIEEENSEAAISAIEKGADIHLANDSGQTPLIMAVLQGNESLVSSLIEYGAAEDMGSEIVSYQRAYDVAVDHEKWNILRFFNQEFSMTQGVAGHTLWVNNPLSSIPYYAGPDIHSEQQGEYYHGTELSLTQRSLLESSIDGVSGHWLYVCGPASEGKLRGWVFDSSLDDQSPLEPDVREYRNVEASGGLNLRQRPNQNAPIVTTIPNGDRVFLIRREGEAFSIGGRTGQWSYVEWQQNRGWIFGGFLNEPPPLQIRLNVPYRAQSMQGNPETFALSSTETEIIFLEGYRVEYQESQNDFEGSIIHSYSGSYSIKGQRIELNLDAGIETHHVSEEFAAEGGAESYEAAPVPLDAFSLILVRLDDPALDQNRVFLIRENVQRNVERQGYTADHSAYHYFLEDRFGFTTIGYFHQSGE